MNKYLKIGIFLIILISIIIGIVYAVKYFKNQPFHSIIEPDVLFLVDDFSKKYSYTLLPESKTGISYAFSFWIYINNLPENSLWNTNYKLEKGIISHYGSPNVYYIPKENIVRIKIGYRDSRYRKKYYNHDIRACNFQTWENIIVTVNDRYISVYLNCKNICGTSLETIPWISDRMMYIGESNNNFNGYIGLVEYFNTTLDKDEINKLYSKNKHNKIFSNKLIKYSEYYKNK